MITISNFGEKSYILRKLNFTLVNLLKIGSLGRFFLFLHFLKAFSLNIHGKVEFLMGTQIKPGSPSGAV